MYESQHPYIGGCALICVPPTTCRRRSRAVIIRQRSVSRLEDDDVDCPRCPSTGRWQGYRRRRGNEASQPSDINRSRARKNSCELIQEMYLLQKMQGESSLAHLTFSLSFPSHGEAIKLNSPNVKQTLQN